jgi:hypothetical protein
MIVIVEGIKDVTVEEMKVVLTMSTSLIIRKRNVVKWIVNG